MTSVKNVTSYSKSFFEDFLTYLVCVFQVNKQQFSIQKKYDGDNSTLTLRRRLQGQNTSVGIALTELTKPSDTLNYRPFFKHCVLQTVLHVLFLFIFVWKKTLCSKKRAVFYIVLIWFGFAFGITVIKVPYFWCSFQKVIGSQGFISYCRYNLLEQQ